MSTSSVVAVLDLDLDLDPFRIMLMVLVEATMPMPMPITILLGLAIVIVTPSTPHPLAVAVVVAYSARSWRLRRLCLLISWLSYGLLILSVLREFLQIGSLQPAQKREKLDIYWSWSGKFRPCKQKQPLFLRSSLCIRGTLLVSLLKTLNSNFGYKPWSNKLSCEMRSTKH
uniref:Uncharacterized protein n=1 Tax=Opuntia streptacantha TaxID=393608 RepID=A0A7C8Z998_OPUST